MHPIIRFEVDHIYSDRWHLRDHACAGPDVSINNLHIYQLAILEGRLLNQAMGEFLERVFGKSFRIVNKIDEGIDKNKVLDPQVCRDQT